MRSALRVTRKAIVALDLHAREELVEVGGDDLLEGHEALAVGHHHEAGQQRRHLHPGEAALAGVGVAHDDGQVERQVGDVRERVAGVDGERREHREDALLEHLVEVLAVVVVELVPAREHDAGLGQRGHDLVEEDPLLARASSASTRSRMLEQLLGRACGRRACAASMPGGDLVLEAGDPDLEELVEVAG